MHAGGMRREACGLAHSACMLPGTALTLPPKNPEPLPRALCRQMSSRSRSSGRRWAWAAAWCTWMCWMLSAPTCAASTTRACCSTASCEWVGTGWQGLGQAHGGVIVLGEGGA